MQRKFYENNLKVLLGFRSWYSTLGAAFQFKTFFTILKFKTANAAVS